MCPLFAKEGSPWTGEKNAKCEGPDCGWYGKHGCEGAVGAQMQVEEASEGGRVLIAIDTRKRLGIGNSKTYDCERAHECQWQQRANGLCPPRQALARGLDPRVVAF